MPTTFTPQGHYTKEAYAQAPAIAAVMRAQIARLMDAGFPPREAGHLITDVLGEEVLLRILTPTAPNTVPVAVAHDAAKGRAAYLASLDDSIHCNRYPSWEELTPEVQAEWIWKAA